MADDKTLLDTVGNTPLVRVDRVLPAEAKANDVRVLCKLEMQNPGGSAKDRIALNLIADAEKKGLLRPGMTVVEYTSGNTGIGLAMVCAAKGYKCIIAMPQIPTFKERYIICRMFGAEVYLSAPAKGLPSLKDYVEELVKGNDTYFLTNQFHNEANPAQLVSRFYLFSCAAVHGLKLTHSVLLGHCDLLSARFKGWRGCAFFSCCRQRQSESERKNTWIGHRVSPSQLQLCAMYVLSA